MQIKIFKKIFSGEYVGLYKNFLVGQYKNSETNIYKNKSPSQSFKSLIRENLKLGNNMSGVVGGLFLLYVLLRKNFIGEIFF